MLRMIEIKAPTGQEWPVFTSFGFRGVDCYENPEGPDIHLFRGDKFYMPVTSFPCSPQDFTRMLYEQKVFQQVKEWLTGLIVACGGTMVISDPAFDAALSHSFDWIPTELKKLFKLPELGKPTTFNKPDMVDDDEEEDGNS